MHTFTYTHTYTHAHIHIQLPPPPLHTCTHTHTTPPIHTCSHTHSGHPSGREALEGRRPAEAQKQSGSREVCERGAPGKGYFGAGFFLK